MPKPKYPDCPLCGSAVYPSNGQVTCDNNSCSFSTDSKHYTMQCGYFAKLTKGMYLNKDRCQNVSVVVVRLYTGSAEALCLEHTILRNQLLSPTAYHWQKKGEAIRIVKGIHPLAAGSPVPVIPEPVLCHLLGSDYWLTEKEAQEKNKRPYDGRRHCVVCGPYYVEEDKQSESHRCDPDKLRSHIGFFAGKSHT